MWVWIHLKSTVNLKMIGWQLNSQKLWMNIFKIIQMWKFGFIDSIPQKLLWFSQRSQIKLQQFPHIDQVKYYCIQNKKPDNYLSKCRADLSSEPSKKSCLRFELKSPQHLQKLYHIIVLTFIRCFGWLNRHFCYLN